MNWYSTEGNSTNHKKNHSYILSNELRSQQNVDKRNLLATEIDVKNNNTSWTQCLDLCSSVDNYSQNTSFLDKTSKQQISENSKKFPMVCELSTRKFASSNNSNVHNYFNSQENSKNYLRNVKCPCRQSDEIDCLYWKLRKSLKQNSLLEYYFLLILQHLVKSLLLLNNNFIYRKNECVYTTYMYNIYYIIIIWKKLIQNCHLLICTSKIIHENNFSYCKTLTTIQKCKSQSLTDFSNVMIYNKYPWNISRICHSFSHCFGSSLPILKTKRSTVLNIVQSDNEMITSTSSSCFESICSDSELINKPGEIIPLTISPEHSICLSKEVTKEPSDTEMKSPEFSDFSSMNKIESLEKSCVCKNNTLANSFMSNDNCSVSHSKSLSTTPELPSFPPPPPPLPPTLFIPSKVPALNNTFIESQQPYCQEIKDQIAPSHIINRTYASEYDINKLKPFRWTKICTSQQASVWSNKSSNINNNKCMKNSDHSDTSERHSRNFINLDKLSVLFVQQQKGPMKIPEVNILPNKDSHLPPVSLSKQIIEGKPNYDPYPQKYFDNTNTLENNQTLSQTSNYKLLDTVNYCPTRGRSLSSSRTMKFTQKCHETNLLESHRCLNINIFLRQFRHFHINLLDLINKCNGSSVGSERLKDLIKLLPTDQEIKSLMTFQGDVKIITSPLICELLQTVLEIGNYMNKGGSLGSATGFKISSLLKLSEVRSNDPKITLLHFFVQVTHSKKNSRLSSYLYIELKTNNPQMLLIAETMPQLKEASDVSLDSIIKEINRFRSRLQNTAQYVDEETFEEQSRIREFIEKSNHELNGVQTQVKKVQDLEIKCAQYFCECPTRFRITECLQTFNLFFEKMKSTEQEIKEYEQTNKDRLEKVIRNVELNNTNTEYENKRCRLVENNAKLNQDDHNIMINMISRNLSNLKIVHNRSSRPSTNKLNSFASSNSLSKYIIESDKSNKDKKNTDESNMVSKLNIPHSISLCENKNKIHNNNIKIRSHQLSEQSRRNTRCQFTDNESERERKPWPQIQSQPTNSSVNDINHQSDESKKNSNSEESIYHLNERIKQLSLRFNKN
ncbi:hypothetical protein MN116_006084 [Schistosoma mekongi]|uniref:FH2 domain-containing protein n=1 Tax=Schistosoma mekongi TaxID=38744 RepID=A0AAE1ZAE6_SCHME|nr:hypothetical protein MN116_006084 [Schistosoma mekongi]